MIDKVIEFALIIDALDNNEKSNIICETYNKYYKEYSEYIGYGIICRFPEFGIEIYLD